MLDLFFRIFLGTNYCKVKKKYFNIIKFEILEVLLIPTMPMQTRICATSLVRHCDLVTPLVLILRKNYFILLYIGNLNYFFIFMFAHHSQLCTQPLSFKPYIYTNLVWPEPKKKDQKFRDIRAGICWPRDKNCSHLILKWGLRWSFKPGFKKLKPGVKLLNFRLW